MVFDLYLPASSYLAHDKTQSRTWRLTVPQARTHHTWLVLGNSGEKLGWAEPQEGLVERVLVGINWTTALDNIT